MDTQTLELLIEAMLKGMQIQANRAARQAVTALLVDPVGYRLN